MRVRLALESFRSPPMPSRSHCRLGGGRGRRGEREEGGEGGGGVEGGEGGRQVHVHVSEGSREIINYNNIIQYVYTFGRTHTCTCTCIQGCI